MQTRLSDTAYLDSLDRSTASIAALASSMDTASHIPSCPNWNVRDLLEHLGGVHAWSRSVIAGGNPRDPKPLLNGAEPVAWYADQAAAMLEAMRAVDPQQSSWSFRPAEPVAAFWFRRQAHETEMHLLDLALAAGEVDAHSPALAADGVSETLDVMVPRMNRDRRVAVAAPILFSATDTGGHWLIRPASEPAVVDYTYSEGPAPEQAAVRVSATADALLTGMWRRTPYQGWEISGDVAVLTELMDSSLTP
ncbi:maleylpyruvate isomerase family mycothiol-dependent enzyme [Cumulibacter soli]|uniref:maleylpyruvate isomerase family mycothiol-dependent enzyme n=1 Tax=Cumulibacter soli TaxID=2546344 RepID=UPI001067AD3D|nr:maleylpyruvate isomerase family mycothiol-dependent enzyme [Cumulibacter soli]